MGGRESAESWGVFLNDLKARGLKGKHLALGVMDGLKGLEVAFEECFPKAKIQRCIVHKLRNIAVKLPRSIKKECLSECKRIFYASSLAEALKLYEAWRMRWGKVAGQAVECLAKDLEVVLTFYDFPKNHWLRIRTTNILERCFKEFRRRTRQMDSFPNEDCCLRIIFALSEDMNERWQRYRIRNFSIKGRAKEGGGCYVA